MKLGYAPIFKGINEPIRISSDINNYLLSAGKEGEIL
jgi:hypothetical protein